MIRFTDKAERTEGARGEIMNVGHAVCIEMGREITNLRKQVV